MHNNSRRSFLQGLLISTLSFGVHGRELQSNSAALDEYSSSSAYIELYHQWLNKTGQDPFDYLNQIGVTNVPDKHQTKRYVKQDFEKHNILEIDGFILSKTESAILAGIGKNHLDLVTHHSIT